MMLRSWRTVLNEAGTEAAYRWRFTERLRRFTLQVQAYAALGIGRQACECFKPSRVTAAGLVV